MEVDRAKRYQEYDYIQLIFKGAFEYFLKGKVYTEEDFLLYKNLKDQSLIYDTEMLTRLESGELLRILETYQVSKEFIPMNVTIDKYFGKQYSKEVYSLKKKSNVLTYSYTLNTIYKEHKILVPPKFHIASPCLTTAFLFISSKKYDPTGKNFYNILVSDNLSSYRSCPRMEYVVLDMAGSAAREIYLHNKKLKAVLYNVYSHENFAVVGEDPVRAFMSKHYSIPYQVEFPGDKIKVTIKYFNEMESSEVNDLFS